MQRISAALMLLALLVIGCAQVHFIAPLEKITIQNDVHIPTRDGSYLLANVYRPSGSEIVPAILTLGPYGKDRLPWYPEEDEDGEFRISELCAFETPDPGWWVPRGYAIVRVDARGLGSSPGRAGVFPAKEREDYYDAIEWAASQTWCNGQVGLLGASYYAVNQWHAAGEQPPHLKAIIPWEGFTDLYRDGAYHGGIPSDAFIKHWFQDNIVGNTHEDTTSVEPFDREALEHDRDDEYYDRKSVDLTKVTVPVYAVTNWGAHGLHLRGVINGFLEAASEHKWLRVHGGIKLEDFYAPENLEVQKRFFDCFLKGEENGFKNEPPIRLAIRTNKDKVQWLACEDWPVRDTEWTKLYLNADQMTLSSIPSTDQASVTYKGYEPFLGSSGAVFESQPMSAQTEIVGPVAARLWVSSSVEDMDVFVTLRVLDECGDVIHFYGEDTSEAPAAQGWLRVSHRETDPARSKPYQPWHVHGEKQPLRPHETVPIDVEIWPTSFVLKKNYRLRVEILPHDPDGIGDIQHLSTIDSGENTIHTGGEHASYLLLPVINRTENETP